MAGLANFVRTYKTGDEDNCIVVDNVPDETNAVIAGVGTADWKSKNMGADRVLG